MTGRHRVIIPHDLTRIRHLADHRYVWQAECTCGWVGNPHVNSGSRRAPLPERVAQTEHWHHRNAQ